MVFFIDLQKRANSVHTEEDCKESMLQYKLELSCLTLVSLGGRSDYASQLTSQPVLILASFLWSIGSNLIESGNECQRCLSCYNEALDGRTCVLIDLWLITTRSSVLLNMCINTSH